MLDPRDYQEDAIGAIDQAEQAGVRRPLVVHPTGTGKTVTFSHLLARRAARGRGLVLVHRDELVNQSLDKLAMIAPELSVGVVKAERNEVGSEVVVASVDTVRRDNRLADLIDHQQREGCGPFATVVVDEAHHAPAASWTKVLRALGAWRPAGPLTVGFTATPQRDGKSLGVWERVVAYKSIREMIFYGHLCPVVGQQVETSMDLNDVKVTGGDFQDGDLGGHMEASGAVDEIADAYVKYARDRKGLAFTPTVRTAYQLAAALRQRGITAEALDGTTPDEERRLILKRLHAGDTQVVCNCGVLTEGFDEPSISCVVVARPTKFHGLYVQMVGRGTRKYPGKNDLLVLDVVGASERHDLVAVVDLGLDDGAGRDKKEPGEGYQCPLCRGPCIDPAHRCRLCGRPLPVQSALDGATRHDSCRAGRTGSVDVFAASKLRWLPVEDAWCLPAGKEVVLMVPAGTDVYRLVSYENGRLATLHDQLPAQWAQGIGEDRAKAFGNLAKRDAYWLSQPVSDAQLGRLVREGFPHEKLNRVRTQGQAADLITRIQARRAVRKLKAGR